MVTNRPVPSSSAVELALSLSSSFALFIKVHPGFHVFFGQFPMLASLILQGPMKIDYGWSGWMALNIVLLLVRMHL
jgi:hypothetical protein